MGERSIVGAGEEYQGFSFSLWWNEDALALIAIGSLVVIKR